MILIFVSLHCLNQAIVNMKYSELERKLKKYGCYFVRDGSRHPIWYSPITGNEFELSFHGSQEVKFGTMKSISKQSGVKL